MSTSFLLERQFAQIGARVKLDFGPRMQRSARLSIDIGHDAEGEYFEVAWDRASTDVRLLDAQPRLRHLLLMAEQNDGKHKFLCGHDERHWFVAAVPERLPVSTVKTAFEALKPLPVRSREDQLRVAPRHRNRRRNAAFVRQGEWFFVPVESLPVAKALILPNEPLRRGGGKPHICSELVRQGGELVYVNHKYPQGLTETQLQRLLNQQPKLRNLQWVAQRRNPQVYVRGRIRHPDHKTIVLNGWHRVFMNTETESAAMRHVAFID